jgi:hypothetical protein
VERGRSWGVLVDDDDDDIMAMLNSFKDNNADVLLFSQLHIIIII